METQAKPVLVFSGAEYLVDKIREAARSKDQVPTILVDVNDLFVVQDDALVLNAAPTVPVDVARGDNDIAVIKWEGKYMVLLGTGRVMEASGQVKVKLISRPMLKRCKVEKEYAPAPYEPPAYETRSRSGNEHISRPYPRDFSNSPRIGEARENRPRPNHSMGNFPSSGKTHDTPRQTRSPMVGSYSGKEDRYKGSTPAERAYQPRSDNYDRHHEQIRRMISTPESNPSTDQRVPRNTGGRTRLYGRKPQE